MLDLNSVYLYLLLCRDFSDTCMVACDGSQLLGFVSAYRVPSTPEVLFVWQVGVAPAARRRGIGLALLQQLVDLQGDSVSVVEATIAAQNKASRRLFESLAERLQSQLLEVPGGGFAESDFPQGEHQAEPRVRIPLVGTGCL